MKDKFPKLFNAGDNAWFATLTKNLDTKLSRNKVDNNDDCSFTLGIQKLNPTGWFGPDRNGLPDLDTIVGKILNDSNPSRDAATMIMVLLLTYHGVGRGGEPKFLSYDDTLLRKLDVRIKLEDLAYKKLYEFECKEMKPNIRGTRTHQGLGRRFQKFLKGEALLESFWKNQFTNVSWQRIIKEAATPGLSGSDGRRRSSLLSRRRSSVVKEADEDEKSFFVNDPEED